MREACGWLCPQKKKEGRRVRYRDEDQERTRGREKEKRIVHEDDECGTMSWPCEDKVLMGPTPTTSTGHAVIASQRA